MYVIKSNLHAFVFQVACILYHSLDYAQISGRTNSPARSSPKTKGRNATGSPAHSIVVVAEGTAPNEDARLASELQKMRDIPTFMPLIRGAPSLSSMDEASPMDKLDHR